MNIFLDLTGTITDIESEDYAFLKMCEAIKERFKISMSAEEIMRHILEFRKPYMENRHIQYYPIRNLIVKAVQDIVPRRLCSYEVFWIMDTYSEYHGKYVSLAFGAYDALREMKKISSYMALVTDADRPYTEEVLSSLGIDKFFDFIITAEDAGVGKPNPKIFHMALNRAKEGPKIYIGDSERRDIVGAKKVGMVAIKIGEYSSMADYNVENLLEALEIIKSLIQ